jgi:hypothetical protein
MESAMCGWESALLALLAGGLGGVVNALMSDNGFALPQNTPSAAGGVVWRPGIVGNVVIGAVAALVSWGLYGSGAGMPIISALKVDLTWAGFAGGVLVGIGGSRWLTAEVDKTLLKNAASAAASKPANPVLATNMANLSPAKALDAALKA